MDTESLQEDELFCDVEVIDVTKLEIGNDEVNDYDEDDFSDDYYEDEHEETYFKCSTQEQYGNTQSLSNKLAKYQPNENLFNKFSNKINVEKYEGPASLPGHATNRLIEKQRQNENDRIRVKDKHDRATAEQVMDPRTRMILFKLLNRNIIAEINGCISTGKEANVYHATLKNGSDCAIKIYKTSILVFKDRDKYVSGEFRFRNGYCRHNPRKMVRTWAEKEMRNLSRMYNNDLRVPEPILLRSHVLVMGFIGENGWPAAKLKDVELSPSKAREVYRDIVVIMWKMYNKCKLVHADLSEFNMLYQNGEIFVIDVSQSVEHDHPRALDFLRKDCTNVTDYFRKKDVATMGIKQLFDFITDPTITEGNMDECLEILSENAALKNFKDITSEEKIEEEVFKNAYIPKRLTEVIDFERDIIQSKSGIAEDLVYKTLVGLKSDLSGTNQNPDILNTEKENDVEENESSNDDSEESSEDDKAYRPTFLGNWEVTHWYPKHPCYNVGPTTIISNENGNLLFGVPRDRSTIWGTFRGTWKYPKRIPTRKLANELSAPRQDKIDAWNRHCKKTKELLLIKLGKKSAPVEKKLELFEEKPEPQVEQLRRFSKYRYQPDQICDDVAQLKGFPRTKEDFVRDPEKKTDDLKFSTEEFYKKHREMLTEEYSGNQCYGCKKDKMWSSPFFSAMKNFNLARKLHKENLEHQPLPDALTDAVYRKLQMQRHREPGLALKEGNYASGVAWKAYAAYGPTRCTKLKVFRPKTSICNKIKDSANDRPSSVSSFDKKWRFIRQTKVTPIQLAVCWDLTPANPKDEPKRTPHIDGSNGSMAPAVFSLVHSADNRPKKASSLEDLEQTCDGLHDYGNDLPYMYNPEAYRPKTACNYKSPPSVESSKMKRAHSAAALVSHFPNPIFTHLPPNSPELSNSKSWSSKFCSKDCHQKNNKLKQKRLCVACELKNINLKDTKPKSDFKMAFKAGVPQKVSTDYMHLPNTLRIPKMKDPYKRRNYNINSLAPPFSLQNYKRHDYPEHWRLATIYQHSYKPLQARKRTLLDTVFK
ncbi:hypothetical protein FQR65_LT02413 [Abscondita terminalis]|nr:hypothetical protein FQR65_LT02413 [Abscondita terminalis]